MDDLGIHKVIKRYWDAREEVSKALKMEEPTREVIKDIAKALGMEDDDGND